MALESSTSGLPLNNAVLQAYSDYNDVMDLTEELVSGLVKTVKGSYKIQYHAGVQGSSPACHISHPTSDQPGVAGRDVG